MKLKQNQPAPIFNLKDVFDRQIDLQKYRHKKVYLGFFRHAACPFCNLRVHALTKEAEALKAQGVEMIFFFESKSRVILRSSFHQEISPIPLISDPEKEWYKIYGLENSIFKVGMTAISSFRSAMKEARSENVPVGDGGMMPEGEALGTMPAEFLLDKGLIIQKAHYAQRLNDWLPLDKIREFARAESAKTTSVSL
jgi:thioredoxin-dependent peroxiredoxin